MLFIHLVNHLFVIYVKWWINITSSTLSLHIPIYGCAYFNFYVFLFSGLYCLRLCKKNCVKPWSNVLTTFFFILNHYQHKITSGTVHKKITQSWWLKDWYLYRRIYKHQRLTLINKNIFIIKRSLFSP